MNNFEVKRLNGIIYVLSVLLLLFISFKLMIFLIPFIVAAMIVAIVKPLIAYIEKKRGIKSDFIKTILLLLFYLIVGTLVFIILFKIIIEGYNFSKYIIETQNSIENNARILINNLNSKLSFLPEYVTNILNTSLLSISTVTSKYFLPFFKSGLSILSSLPKVMLFSIITIISSFIMLKDEKVIVKMMYKQFPQSWITKFYQIKDGVLKMLFVYISAQIMLITLCFIELFIGLNIINMFISSINYVLFFAFIICIVDALPMIGAAAVLIPWAIFEAIVNSNYNLSISLIILNVIVMFLRQFLEPKLMSKGAQTNPLITLVAMYSGFRFFGIIGFLIGPVVMSILKIVFYEEIKYGFFKFLIKENNEKNS